jgi:hypothetical protein
MKKNLLFALSLMMFSAFTLAVAAQQPMPIARKTYKMVTLPCQIKKGGDVSSNVLVTNNSGYTIPVNTKVYVEIAGASTPNLQQSVFANNTTRQMYGPADHSGSCTAKASVAVN